MKFYISVLFSHLSIYIYIYIYIQNYFILGIPTDFVLSKVKHALNSSTGVGRGVTGNVERKSLANKISLHQIGFSIDFLYDTGKF